MLRARLENLMAPWVFLTLSILLFSSSYPNSLQKVRLYWRDVVISAVLWWPVIMLHNGRATLMQTFLQIKTLSFQEAVSPIQAVAECGLVSDLKVFALDAAIYMHGHHGGRKVFDNGNSRIYEIYRHAGSKLVHMCFRAYHLWIVLQSLQKP